MLGIGYFPKIAKINSQQEKPICPESEELVPAKHKNSPIRKNKLLQKFRATWYLLLARNLSFARDTLRVIHAFLVDKMAFFVMLVPNHEQALQQIVALKKEVSELRAKLASQEEDYHKSEGEMHAEVTDVTV